MTRRRLLYYLWLVCLFVAFYFAGKWAAYLTLTFLRFCFGS